MFFPMVLEHFHATKAKPCKKRAQQMRRVRVMAGGSQGSSVKDHHRERDGFVVLEGDLLNWAAWELRKVARNEDGQPSEHNLMRNRKEEEEEEEEENPK